MSDDAQRDRLTAEGVKDVRVADYPGLQSIAWSLRDDAQISERDALALYERNWRHVGKLSSQEEVFVRHLAARYSGGRLLV